MADNSTPYAYPTPEMVAQYIAGTKAGIGARGPMSPLAAPGSPLNTSQLGAPQAPPTATTSMITRGLRGFRNWLGYTILGADGANALMPPQQPLQPIAQHVDQAAVGRPWDYPVGYNTRVTPRDGAPVSFATLKNLAVGYDLLAILIDRVKSKVVSQQWNFVIRDELRAALSGNRDARCDELTRFFESPDREHTFDEWLRMLLDQVIMYDAPALWLQPTRGGGLYALKVIDGSLVSPKIDALGNIPSPEIGVAYQVVFHGLPAVDYIKPVPLGVPAPLADDGFPLPELLYKPRNPRVDSVYGFGPVEQIITTVNIALRREAYLLTYYTDGSTPDLLISCPKEWNPDQISRFKVWWDSVLAGNLGARRGTMFIPDGSHQINTKEKALTDETDQWLIRICCFALGLNPMPFIKQMNRGQEKTHHDEASQEGLEPWLEWVANLVNQVVRLKWGYDDVVFRWKEDEATDELERAQIDQIYLQNKVYHPDEIRAKRGDAPMPDDMREQLDMPTYSQAVNATVLPPDQQAEADARQQAKAEQMAALKPAMPPPNAAPGVAAAKLGKGQPSSRSRATARGY